MNKFFLYILAACTLCMFWACDKSDKEPDYDEDEQFDPDAEVPDPEGTVILSMRNNKGTRLDGSIYIDEGDNFSGASFASLGAVNGLGNVSYIPTTGWASKMAVMPGNGYVAYSGGVYYRIYVLGYTLSGSDAIIGADVKYQKPFWGTDAKIKLTTDLLTFSGESGGEQSLVFENTTVIPFTVESDAEWCRVLPASTLDESFLYNAINISVEPLNLSENVTATVTLTTLYGEETVLTVTQTAAKPFIDCSVSSVSLEAGADTRAMSVLSNVPSDDISVKTDVDWLKVSLVDYSQELIRQQAAVKYVAGVDVTSKSTDASGAKSYSLEIACEENRGVERKGTVTLTAKGAEAATVDVTQEGYVLNVQKEELYFDRNAGNQTINVSSNGSVDIEAVSSDPDWCTVSSNGKALTVRVTATDADREAVISFPGFDDEIKVVQSKYAVGDEYSEDCVTGTVSYMTDSVRIVTRELGEAQWSVENVLVGASDRDDGRKNSEVIKAIPNWKELYPAFALVDELNVNGVTGWYMLALNEMRNCGFNTNTAWTSTENSESGAYTPNNYNTNDPKSESKTVVAGYRF